MGLFEQFPYTNYHELNLDWIINTFKEKMESAVMSVNGLTGEVTLYQSPYVQFPDIPDTSWNVYRISDGEATGIQFRKGQPAQRIDHVNRYDIYDAGNPPPYPVTTVNGMSGDVYDFFMTANNILKFPEGTSNTAWELIREIANNTELGLRTQYDSVNDVYEAFICYKETGDIERYVKLLTPADIPSSSGVVSFNGQTGVVTASGADLNINALDNTSIDQTITNIENDIAIIINGSTSAKNVSAGQYVLVQNSGMTGVNDGLYIANTTVSAGTPFTSAYLDPVSNGGLNSLNDEVAKRPIFILQDLISVNTGILVFNEPMSFTNGVGSMSVLSHIPPGYSVSASCFAIAQDTGSLAVTGCLISGNTITVKLSNQSFTGSTTLNFLLVIAKN